MFTNGLPVIDPIACPDVFVSGVACCEPLGSDHFRITHYAKQFCSALGQDCAVIVARLVVSGDTIATGKEYVWNEVAKSRLLVPKPKTLIGVSQH